MKSRNYFGEPKNSKRAEKRDILNFTGPERDGSQVIERSAASFNGRVSHAVSANPISDIANEGELIRTYRDISDHPDVGYAIEEIINEIFVTDGVSLPITLNLDFLDEIGRSDIDDLKAAIEEEWLHVLRLLNFNQDAFEIFRRFYVDSRLAYYKVVDPENLEEGIQELRSLDPISLRKVKLTLTDKEQMEDGNYVKSYVDESDYFVYQPNRDMYSSADNGFGSLFSGSISNLYSNQDQMILKEYSVAYVDTGMLDHTRNFVKGYLHKVIKPLNDLLNLEVHMIIYRVARAPERRVFYIDTGDMPPNKAQQYLNSVQDTYRREVSYDAKTGKVNSDSNTISMHEDYWLPRSSGGKGTEIDTLAGAQNLSQIEDIEYLKKTFLSSLNVPTSRFEREGGNSLFFGANNEMDRVEVSFQKFISRLRSRFNILLKDILGTQLILRGVLTLEEWEQYQNQISLKYVKDSYLEDSRKFSVWQQKAAVVADLEPLTGKYISKGYIWREILGFSSDEIEEMRAEIEEERKSGEYDGDDF